jgi:hypothetical protein
MSICDRVEVHYININSATKEENSGVYEVSDLQISPEDSSVVICSWLLSYNATKHEGITSFLLRFACTTDGELDYVWNTAIYSEINVSKGIYNSGIVIEDYADILAQWHQDLFETGGNAVVNIKDAESKTIEALKNAAAAKEQEVLDNIPDDYQTLDANVTEYKSKVDSLANAIKGKMSGAVVRADDVSPVEHGVCVCVYSKNLIDVTKIAVQEESNIYISAVGEGYIEITTKAGYESNGHRQTYIKLKDLCPQMQPNRTYVLSAETNSIIKMAHLRDMDYFIDFGKPVFITEEMLESYLAFYGLDTRNDTTGGVCRISNIQFEEGPTPTEYTPYVDPASVTVTKCGKNVFNKNNYTIAYDNATINNQSNNVFDITGEVGGGALMYSTGAFAIKLPQGLKLTSKIAVSLYVTLVEVGAYDNQLRYYAYNDAVALASETISLKVGERTKITMICEDIGEIMTRILFYLNDNRIKFEVDTLQIEYADTVTDFNECVETTYTPATDGTILGMKSLSPTMTLLTDTSGAIVECEYNRDTNAVILDLYNKIADLSATT